MGDSPLVTLIHWISPCDKGAVPSPSSRHLNSPVRCNLGVTSPLIANVVNRASIIWNGFDSLTQGGSRVLPLVCGHPAHGSRLSAATKPTRSTNQGKETERKRPGKARL